MGAPDISSSHAAKPLALTMGDPAGIGPEITGKAWEALRGTENSFALIAPPAIMDEISIPVAVITDFDEAAALFGSKLPLFPIDGNIAPPGKPSPNTAPAITQSIETAVRLALEGRASGIVTNPISKDVLYASGFKHPGHTEYLGALTASSPAPYARGPVMMLSGGGLRVGLTTVHLSLKDAARALSMDITEKNARVICEALRCDFGIETPRLALTGLNPHAGENGALGREEIEVINPAAQNLRHAGFDVTDAQPADTLFHAEARKTYDAVLAMYHDQGLIPVKTLDFHGGVNITLGLPVVRTSPDHGTAFNIAGKGVARPDSLIAAIKAARHIANNRYGHAG